MDGADFQDWAVDCGLVVETKYDPAIHGSTSVCEPDDPWYEPTPELSAYLKVIFANEERLSELSAREGEAQAKPTEPNSSPNREQVIAELWETIDTAPNSGQVWALGGRHSSPSIVEADGTWWRLNKGVKAIPTHWMPLQVPAVPAALRKGAAR
jgi:hypothetical protein